MQELEFGEAIQTLGELKKFFQYKIGILGGSWGHRLKAKLAELRLINFIFQFTLQTYIVQYVTMYARLYAKIEHSLLHFFSGGLLGIVLLLSLSIVELKVS